jgi:hypothetical protein
MGQFPSGNRQPERKGTLVQGTLRIKTPDPLSGLLIPFIARGARSAPPPAEEIKPDKEGR